MQPNALQPTSLPTAAAPASGWPPAATGYPAGTALGGSVPTGAASGLGLPSAYANAAGLGEAMLSIGEKLAMLDHAQNPTQLSSSRLNGSPGAGGVAAAMAGPRDSIRLASFNLNGWGEAKRGNAAVAGLLTRLLSQFDLIAVQDIRSRQDDSLPELVTLMNSGGRKFDFMIGPRVGRGERREQLGFIFDTERVETDRFQLYTVDDPEDMLSREPLVGWFRTVHAVSQDAFTFSLVNLRIDPDLAHSELGALPVLVQAIINDGRGEDDIILAGDFGPAASQLELLSAAGMRVLLEGVATTTRGSQLLDNIAFPQASTTEYTGRSGAFDFLRQFNLSLEQAVEVSEHLPIWAEFSIIEGGRPGQVAGNALPVQRFQNDYH